MSKLAPISVHDLGGYLREQRQAAQLSLRQLSEVAGVSNPYLSQIERGLKKPSAEILQQLARGLRISAESLYVRAGILEEQAEHGDAPVIDVRAAVLADRRLTDRQRSVLLDVYESFVGGSNEAAAGGATPTPTTGHTAPTDAAAVAAAADGAEPGTQNHPEPPAPPKTPAARRRPTPKASRSPRATGTTTPAADTTTTSRRSS
jgi:transcriptional regulator with XRE-family HTH domain